MSGSSTTRSACSQIAPTTGAAPRSPSVFGEPQPHEFASVTPMSSEHERGAQQRRAEPVDLRVRHARRGRHEQDHADDRGRGDDDPAPEEPRHAGVLHEQRPTCGQPDAAADAEHRAEQADRARDPVGRERVPDDPEGEREDAAGHALHRAPGDDPPDRRAPART